MKRQRVLLAILIILVVVLIVLSAMLGAVKIRAKDVVLSVFAPKSVKSSTVYIIKSMRLPRALCAVVAGALLSLSGLVFQCVFRNPMADSYVLGISSSSSLTVALALLFGFVQNSVTLPVTAFIGAIIGAAILFSTSRSNPLELLLSGIAVNFLFSALTTLLVYLKKRELEAIMYWTMGSLSNTTWPRVAVLIAVLVFTVIILEKYSSAMDIILLDDGTALSSGVNISSIRLILLLVASAAVGSVVAFCGVIGFVGLMSPHFVRLIAGPKHRTLIPFSALMGSVVLIASDLVSRVVLVPTELPIGIVTSILGAPVFFVLLKRKRSWIR